MVQRTLPINSYLCKRLAAFREGWRIKPPFALSEVEGHGTNGSAKCFDFAQHERRGWQCAEHGRRWFPYGSTLH